MKEIRWSGWQGGGGTSEPRGEPSAGGAAGGSSSGGYGGSYGGDGAGGAPGDEPLPMPEELCRNGIIDAGEECDGDLFRQEETCDSRMPGSVGQLYCTDHCHVDFSACEMLCGNGQIDAGEECDPGVPTGECANLQSRVRPPAAPVPLTQEH